MSQLAIAAVTATLRSLLQKEITTGDVTTLPLDKAGNVGQANRLNLFLYHMMPNAAWRNQAIPNKTKAGEPGYPPLALNLFYLLTAYGDDQTDEADHRLLGTGMRILHDKAVLANQDIRDATDDSPLLKAAALDRQFEQVKITPEHLSLEEMSKLWMTFQTQYRISAAFQLSVVLIESQRAAKAPLPVLKRGSQDQGPEIVPTMPGVLEGVEYSDLRTRTPAFSSAQLGETVTLQGRNLPGARSVVLFLDSNHPPTAAQPDANVVARISPEPDSSDTTIYVRLDPSLPNWTSGPLQVVLEEPPQPGKRSARSNALRFAMSPSLIQNNEMPFIITVENNRRQLILRCNPGISQRPDGSWPEVALILNPLQGGASVPRKALNLTSSSLSSTTPVFDIDDVPHGAYRVRMRVETVETLVMKRDGALLEFDERQVVLL